MKARFTKGMALAFTALMLTLTACTKPAKTVASGSTWVVDKTTRLSRLTIPEDAHITAAPGHDVTLTVNGVETGIQPGVYSGKVVLTPTEENIVKYAFQKTAISYHFRQALYLDRTGIVASKSVLAAAGKYKLHNGVLTGVKIAGKGDIFNGIYVAGGNYTIKDPVINLTGNGSNDFTGYGAGILSVGKDTTLVLDGAKIHTKGAVRTGVVADKGSNLIVKNSEITGQDGVLPADYVPNVNPGHMMSAPWMLGISGNCRATLVVGDNTRATYINSTVKTENWGALSNDISSKDHLTAIDSTVEVTGKNGYGAYSLGGATTSFYGTTLKVRDYGVIVEAGGSKVTFGSSSPERVAKLNSDLKLGLTASELKSLPQQKTTLTSDRFGVMMLISPVAPSSALAAPVASIKVLDDTVFNTGQTVFLDKGLAAHVYVDGSKGAQLNPGNGVIMQLMDTDDPGPVEVNGSMVNKGVFHEPVGLPRRVAGFDVTVPHAQDLSGTFANITLKGDFYNGFRNGESGFKSGKPVGKNLVLKFEKSNVTGEITSSIIKHAKSVITSADYMQLGEVTNRPFPAVNNGLILSLAGSTWTITGTSYLTSLTIDSTSKINAPAGSKVTMTVNGFAKPIKAGTYKGKIILAVTKA